MEKKRIWAEIRCDYQDDEGFWCVDAWKTSFKDMSDEEGEVIAYIDNLTGRIIYTNPLARVDSYAQEIIMAKAYDIWNALKSVDNSIPVTTFKTLYFTEKEFLNLMQDMFDDVSIELDPSYYPIITCYSNGAQRGYDHDEIESYIGEKFGVKVRHSFAIHNDGMYFVIEPKNVSDNKIIVSDIDWDLEGRTAEEAGLPSRIIINEPTEDMLADIVNAPTSELETIANYLTDHYGWCVLSFCAHLGDDEASANQ